MVLAAVLAAIVATVQWRAAAEEAAKSQRVFELRVYYAHPGKMSALHARFRNHTCALFKKHGMDLIGFWSPTDSKEAEEKLIYVLGYPNREAAKKSWKSGKPTPAARSGGWSSWRDTRYKATLLLAPYTPPFIDRGTLGAISVPLMYQGGTLDDFMTPYVEGPVAPFSTGAYEAGGTPRYFAKLNGAEHTSWSVQACTLPGTVNQCVQNQALVGVMATYAVAFFEQHLLGASQPLLHVGDAMFTRYSYAE